MILKNENGEDHAYYSHNVQFIRLGFVGRIDYCSANVCAGKSQHHERLDELSL